MAKRSHRIKIAINIITLLLICIVIYFAWPEIEMAWGLLGQVNIWILLLLIPVQIFSYFANGMTIFSYLRERGKLRHIKTIDAATISLELNFVNHIVPSGGASGITYMIWRLRKLGVSTGQATMAQIVRMAVIAVAFIVCLLVSLAIVTIENVASNWIVAMATVSVTAMIFIAIFSAYLMGSKRRMVSFAGWLTRVINKFVQIVTFNHAKKKAVNADRMKKVFVDIYEDFVIMKQQKKLLIKPLVWGFLFVLADVGLFAISFWALGTAFDPAMLVIGYGAASVIGAIMITPGGAGGYEATMIAVLVAGGMAAGLASAGVILARVILIIGTLATGYVFYHRAVKHFGQPEIKKKVAIDNIKGAE